MVKIIQSSKQLDDTLHEKRHQVDKLVRIRRLLNRLDFLSELPERLAGKYFCRPFIYQYLHKIY